MIRCGEIGFIGLRVENTHVRRNKDSNKMNQNKIDLNNIIITKDLIRMGVEKNIGK